MVCSSTKSHSSWLLSSSRLLKYSPSLRLFCSTTPFSCGCYEVVRLWLTPPSLTEIVLTLWLQLGTLISVCLLWQAKITKRNLIQGSGHRGAETSGIAWASAYRVKWSANTSIQLLILSNVGIGPTRSMATTCHRQPAWRGRLPAVSVERPCLLACHTSHSRTQSRTSQVFLG